MCICVCVVYVCVFQFSLTRSVTCPAWQLPTPYQLSILSHEIRYGVEFQKVAEMEMTFNSLSRDQIERNDYLESLARLLSILSHEIRLVCWGMWVLQALTFNSLSRDQFLAILTMLSLFYIFQFSLTRSAHTPRAPHNRTSYFQFSLTRSGHAPRSCIQSTPAPTFNSLSRDQITISVFHYLDAYLDLSILSHEIRLPARYINISPNYAFNSLSRDQHICLERHLHVQIAFNSLSRDQLPRLRPLS